MIRVTPAVVMRYSVRIAVRRRLGFDEPIQLLAAETPVLAHHRRVKLAPVHVAVEGLDGPLNVPAFVQPQKHRRLLSGEQHGLDGAELDHRVAASMLVSTGLAGVPGSNVLINVLSYV